MSVFKLHLVNRADRSELWNQAMRRMIVGELQQMFDRVARHATARPVTSARVRWASGAGAVRPGDLVVYFSNTRDDGIGRRIDPASLQHSRTGQTVHGGSHGTVSEVYVAGHRQIHGFDSLGTQQKASLLAKGAFHECMHNKLYPLDIHTDGGGGLALATLSYYYGLTDRNVELMAPTLQVDVPQDTRFM